MLHSLLDRLFSRGSSNSREDVKRRLKFVLAHDRADLSPETVEAMRQEILEVLSRYVDIDADDSEFSLESSRQATTLIANLPIRRIKSLSLQEDSEAAKTETETESPTPEIAASEEPAPESESST